MQLDAVAEDLGEDPPGLEPPIERLMARSCPPRHRPTLCRVARVRRAHDFVGMPRVPLVRLDPLARVEKIAEDLVKYSNVGKLTRGVWALDSYQVPPKDTNPQLVAEGGLPRVLVGPEGVSRRRGSLLGDTEVRPVDCHKTVVEDVPLFSTFELDLWRRRRRRGGGG